MSNRIVLSFAIEIQGLKKIVGNLFWLWLYILHSLENPIHYLRYTVDPLKNTDRKKCELLARALNAWMNKCDLERGSIYFLTVVWLIAIGKKCDPPRGRKKVAFISYLYFKVDPQYLYGIQIACSFFLVNKLWWKIVKILFHPKFV